MVWVELKQGEENREDGLTWKMSWNDVRSVGNTMGGDNVSGRMEFGGKVENSKRCELKVGIECRNEFAGGNTLVSTICGRRN